jgi:hypothetical protein
MNEPDIDRLIRDLLDLEKRDKAAFAIAEIGPAARAAVPNLIIALRFEPGNYCIDPFTLALASIGEEAKEAVPALIEMLDLAREDEDWTNCSAAAHALREITTLMMNPHLRKLRQEPKGQV